MSTYEIKPLNISVNENKKVPKIMTLWSNMVYPSTMNIKNLPLKKLKNCFFFGNTSEPRFF